MNFPKIGRINNRLLTFVAICVLIILKGSFGQQQLRETMKAVLLNCYGLPDVLQIQEVRIPVPNKNEVLVKVKAAGINPVDTYMRSGKHGMQPMLPLILGKEIAGIIDKVHSDITVYKVGDRVFCGIYQGGYAEYAIANATDCFPLSEKLTFSQGAALYTNYFTIHRGLVIRGDMQKDSTVLVHGGSGSLGTAAVQIAKHVGAFVVVSVGSSVFKKLMMQSGADYVVYHDSSDEGYLRDSIQKLRKPGFDIILEIISSVNVPRDRRFLSQNGKIIILGNRASFKVRVNINSPVRDKTIDTVNFFQYTEDEKNAAAEYILGGIECGCIRPFIAREYKMEEISVAHVEMARSRTAFGKLTVVF